MARREKDWRGWEEVKEHEEGRRSGLNMVLCDERGRERKCREREREKVRERERGREIWRAV